MDGIRVAAQGRVGSDAELRTSKAGREYLRFQLAVDVGTKDEPKTEWLSIFGFTDKPEKTVAKLTKGAECYVEGRLTAEPWLRDGEPQAGLRVLAFVVQPLGAMPGPRRGNGRRDDRQRWDLDERVTSRSTDSPPHGTEGGATGARSGYRDSDVPF